MALKISKAAQTRIQTRLLDWFSKHKRPMPWRLVKSPYRTFISEVMLQQTQIKTVIPYFERWMRAFPDAKTLAAAPIDRVLKLWEGLGYYTRARNLHQAAKIIIDKHGGKIPDDYESLIALPGIGRYTAGAIASIAFGKRTALVDGNVARVLSRIFNIRKDIVKPATQEFLYAAAKELVPEENPGDFNQALMELGSLVCFPVMPNCAACPLSAVCASNKKGNQESLPIKSKAPEKNQVSIAAMLITDGGKVLIRKRPPKGIWGGLWEIPNVVLERKVPRKVPLNGFMERFIRQEYKTKIECAEKESVIVHHLTHLKMMIHPFKLRLNNSPKLLPREKWASRAELKKLSFPVPYRKLLETVFKASGPD